MGSAVLAGPVVVTLVRLMIHVELLVARLPQLVARKRNEFATTLTDERLMASAATMGDSSHPVKG
jgi:hypothetical protein